MKEISLNDAQTKLSELETTGGPKRGCLKSKDFFLSADFDEIEAGFEVDPSDAKLDAYQITRLWT